VFSKVSESNKNVKFYYFPNLSNIHEPIHTEYRWLLPYRKEAKLSIQITES